MKPLVSVVMPVRDGGVYLQAAVDSILSQTHTRLELLLIDDHSTDMAIDALDYADNRLRIIRSNGHGVVAASNTGFSRCTGEFIARMDADDIALPRRLTSQLDYLQNNPAVDIAGCRVEIFSDAGIMGGMQRYQAWLNALCEPAAIHRGIFIESPMPNPGLMFRRSALHRLGGYRDVDWPEDYDLVLRADALGMKMGKPGEILLRWREHTGRITHTDQRYMRARFMRAKSHYLVRHHLGGRDVIIWGAGPTGRLLHDLITAEGGSVVGFIEVHPRRIGGHKRGLPVWPVSKVTDAGGAMVLVAVGAAGAREEIAAFMREHQRHEGRDYLFAA